MDWCIILGLSLNSLWLLTGAIYLSSAVGYTKFVSFPVEKVGNFLEDALAPLTSEMSENITIISGHSPIAKIVAMVDRVCAIKEQHQLLITRQESAGGAPQFAT